MLPVDRRGRRGNLLVQDATLELVVLEKEETLYNKSSFVNIS